MIKSFVSCIKYNDYNKLLLPNLFSEFQVSQYIDDEIDYFD